METNKVYQGDSFKLLKEIESESIDIVITDPPYGIKFRSNYRKVKYEYIENDEKLPIEAIKDCIRIAKKACYIFCRWDNIKYMPEPKSVIVWVKNNWSMGDLKHSHGRQWEAICFYPKKEHKFKKRIPDVIYAKRTGNIYHPTQKPVDLIKKILDANEGETVLDPFIGCGTTALACLASKKRYIGIEIDSRYVDISNKRILEYTE